MAPVAHEGELNYEKLLRDREIGDTLKAVNDAMIQMVQEIEKRSPQHTFGARVFEHMKELAVDAREIARESGLDLRQEKLLIVFLGVHDVGRIVCEFEKPGDRTYQHDHGRVGSEFLESRGLLRGLGEDELVVLRAVEQHSTKEMDLEAGSDEAKICQVGRDLDKSAILCGDEYTAAFGIMQQLDMWMLSEEAKATWKRVQEENLDLTQKVYGWVEAPFKGESYDSLKAVFDWDSLEEPEKKLLQEISDSLTGEIPARYIEKFDERAPLTKDEMIINYPSYVVAQLILAYGVVLPSMRSRLGTAGTIEPRLRFLEQMSPQYGVKIRAVISDFLNSDAPNLEVI